MAKTSKKIVFKLLRLLLVSCIIVIIKGQQISKFKYFKYK